MTETHHDLASDYAALAHRLGGDAARVPDWDEPSPCAGWTRRDVLDHLISTQRDLLIGRGVELPEPPDVGADPEAAWRDHAAAVEKQLSDPAVPATEYDGMFGRTTLGRTLADYYLFDMVVHRWDLLPSTRFTEEELDLVDGSTGRFGDALRWEGVCGPAVAVSDDADRQARVLAFLGRAS